MRRSLSLATVILLLLTACGDTNDADGTQAGSPSSSPSSSSTSEPPPAPEPTCGSGGEIGEAGDERMFTTSNGEERTYLLDVPSAYDESTPADVVFNFHGRGSNAIQQYVYGNYVDLAERDGVVLVTPNSLVRSDRMQWSPGTPGGGDDLDFVAELVDEIQATFCTDRFFATGMSSGGLMTTALACQPDSDFEAFGPVTLWFYNEDCEAAPPRPIIEFHGTDDGVVPFDSGTGDSVIETGAEWAQHNGCDPEPVIETITDEVDHYVYENCDATTEHYVINGGGHSWPGAIEVEGLGKVTDDISASEIVWELFFAPPS